jgi:hypothetical protein
MRRFTVVVSLILTGAALSACGGSSDSSTGAGGAATTGIGGSAGALVVEAGVTGGSSGTGGSLGTGGAVGSGGAIGAGGASTGAGGSPPMDAGTKPTSDASARDASVMRDAAREASPPVTTGDAGGSPYKGVANSACADLVTLGASWYYNWTTSPGTCKNSQFVPMVWGHTGTEQSATGIANEVNGLVNAGYKYILGFNEPDNSGQSNITVANAITLWPSFTNPAAILGSPATQANTTGLAWFSSGAASATFMGASQRRHYRFAARRFH